MKTFTIWLCHSCEQVLQNRLEGSLHSSMAHRVEQARFKLRPRRGNRGPEHQWSTDWIPDDQ